MFARPVLSQYFLFVFEIQKLSYDCFFLRRLISFFFTDSMSTLNLNILSSKFFFDNLVITDQTEDY